MIDFIIYEKDYELNNFYKILNLNIQKRGMTLTVLFVFY